jgi:hypothetical protein
MIRWAFFDKEIAVQDHAPPDQCLHLLDEGGGVHDHAAADHAPAPRVKDPGGN